RRRMKRELHVRVCEGAGVRFLRATRLVVLHEEREVVEQSREVISEWLKEMGLELKESKTRIVHTLEKTEGEAGFEFLGFRIKQYPAGKYNSDRNGHGQPIGCETRIEPSPKAVKRHTEKLREAVKRHRGKKEALLECETRLSAESAAKSGQATQEARGEMPRMQPAIPRWRHMGSGSHNPTQARRDFRDS